MWLITDSQRVVRCQYNVTIETKQRKIQQQQQQKLCLVKLGHPFWCVADTKWKKKKRIQGSSSWVINGQTDMRSEWRQQSVAFISTERKKKSQMLYKTERHAFHLMSGFVEKDTAEKIPSVNMLKENCFLLV